MRRSCLLFAVRCLLHALLAAALSGSSISRGVPSVVQVLGDPGPSIAESPLLATACPAHLPSNARRRWNSFCRGADLARNAVGDSVTRLWLIAFESEDVSVGAVWHRSAS